MGISAIGSHPFGARMHIERYRLEDNGLEVLVLVDHVAPVVSYQTWFKVGSRHEREGKTGIAHLFEHLMFGETKNVPLGEHDRRLEEAGAESNAATYVDWTYYLVNLPSDALELAIGLEADRMHNLVIESDQLESEREVVLNERRLTVDNDIDGTAAELLFCNAFRVHGYRFPTIGFAEDIAALDLDDCRGFYRTYYAPNNACLVGGG
jgi:zinc protease